MTAQSSLTSLQDDGEGEGRREEDCEVIEAHTRCDHSQSGEIGYFTLYPLTDLIQIGDSGAADFYGPVAGNASIQSSLMRIVETVLPPKPKPAASIFPTSSSSAS